MQKRYSEFVALDAELKSQVPQPPPVALPGKSWQLPFMRTSTSPSLVEERRTGLEAYLRVIAEAPDGRWRGTSVWRTFLNLPSSAAGLASSRADAHAAITRLGDTEGGGVNLDAAGWLDLLREMRGGLHDARLWLGKRDGATTGQAQHEAGANAKRCLVKAGALVMTLEEGLKGLGARGGLGEGELRRRGDLLSSAKVEKELLEKLAVSLAVKSNMNGSAVPNGGPAMASTADKKDLFGPAASRPKGRVLGAPVPETERTRELDNEGVLQLQKQLMQEQDLDVDELAKIVRRQKEMSIAINEELELQNGMLGTMDADVDRVGGKLEVTKKRMGKIK